MVEAPLIYHRIALGGRPISMDGGSPMPAMVLVSTGVLSCVLYGGPIWIGSWGCSSATGWLCWVAPCVCRAGVRAVGQGLVTQSHSCMPHILNMPKSYVMSLGDAKYCLTELDQCTIPPKQSQSTMTVMYLF